MLYKEIKWGQTKHFHCMKKDTEFVQKAAIITKKSKTIVLSCQGSYESSQVKTSSLVCHFVIVWDDKNGRFPLTTPTILPSP